MVANNFTACWPIIAQFEGGYSDDPNDPGNWTGGKVRRGRLNGTKYGISAAAHPNVDIRALTLDAAGEIAKHDYWNVMHCDDLPRGFDLMVFNAGFLCGPGRAIGWERIALARGAAVASEIRAYANLELAYFHKLRTYSRYGKGWDNRTLICQKDALAMIGAHVALPSLMPLESSPHYPQARWQTLNWIPRIGEMLGLAA